MRHIASCFIVKMFVLGLFVVAAKAEDWTSYWSSCGVAKGSDAIASCYHLILHGTLPPQLLAAAYNNRGHARLADRDAEGAIKDGSTDARPEIFLVPFLLRHATK